MRFAAAIFVASIAALACCRAQDYTQSEMYKRWDSSRNKAMAAVNSYSTKGRKYKNDPALAATGSGKKFGDSSISVDKKAQGVNAFSTDQKYSSEGYKMTRSFLGIKNPWIGATTFRAEKAGDGTKSLAESGKKYQTETAEIKKAADAGKKMNLGGDVVPVKPWLGKGGSQGSMDIVTEKIKKEMTVEEVRELLNKNH